MVRDAVNERDNDQRIAPDEARVPANVLKVDLTIVPEDVSVPVRVTRTTRVFVTAPADVNAPVNVF